MKNHTSTRRLRLGLPSSLRSRMMLTVTLVAGLLFLVVFGITTWTTRANTSRLAGRYAVERLTEIDSQIALQTCELNSYLQSYTSWTTFYDQTSNPTQAFISKEIASSLIEKTGATAVIWFNKSGGSIYSSGSSADIARLKHLSLETPQPQSGVAAFPDGACTVVISPIVGGTQREPNGTLAIAKVIDPASMVTGTHPTNNTEAQFITTLPPNTSGANWSTVAVNSPHFQAASVYYDPSETRILSEVTSMDDKNGGWFELIDHSSSSAFLGTLPSSLLPASLAGLTLLIGSLVGLILSSLINRPMKRFVEYMRSQSMAAIEGRPTEGTLAVDPGLPDEFKLLGETIRELMQQLTLRQEALKTATERALESEVLFRDVVNATSEVKLLVRDGLIEVANPSACKCLNTSLGNLLDMPFSEALSVNDIRTQNDTPIAPLELLEKAAEDTLTVRCELADHGERWMKCSATRVQDDPRVLLFTARNVTEERKLEALRAEVVSVVSHDLRSPLTVITGYLDILQRDLDAEKRQQVIERAHAAADHMNSLLQDLLDVARSENILAPSVWLPVSLGELADEVAAAHRVGAQRDIVVVKRQEISVPGDPVRLRQALNNLVGNALKYTPENTEITIGVQAEPGYGVITVEDCGEGIPESDRERIFGRYARLDRDMQRATGAGLGLYIVKMVAEGHGGTVTATTGEKGGARFVLRIPLVPIDEA